MKIRSTKLNFLYPNVLPCPPLLFKWLLLLDPKLERLGNAFLKCRDVGSLFWSLDPNGWHSELHLLQIYQSFQIGTFHLANSKVQVTLQAFRVWDRQFCAESTESLHRERQSFCPLFVCYQHWDSRQGFRDQAQS